LKKNKILGVAWVALATYIGILYLSLPKIFYGDSLWFLNLFKSNNWNLFFILIEYFEEFGLYRILGIIVNYFFYLFAAGNIKLIFLYQILLFLVVLWYLSKKISSNQYCFLTIFILFVSIPFSTNALLQPTSFHQLISLLLIIYILFNFSFINSIKDSLSNLLSIKPVLILFLSLFIYEIAFPLFIISFLGLLFNQNKIKNKYYYLVFIIVFVSLILFNQKTLFNPTNFHVDKSIIYQISRYIFYSIYYIKYGVINGIYKIDKYSLIIFINTLLIILMLSFNNSKSHKIITNKINIKNLIIILFVFLSIWLYFPIFNGFIQIPRLNTIFTYSVIFVIMAYVVISKLELKYKYLIILPLFIFSQSLLITQIKGIKKNYEEANQIIGLVKNKEDYDNIILDDYEGQHYFRRYSLKFYSLPYFTFEGYSSINKPNVITSSQLNDYKFDKNIFIKLINDNIQLVDQSPISDKFDNRYDNNAIKIFNNNIYFNYKLNQIYYLKN